MSVGGPTLPSSTSARHGSCQGISRRQRLRSTTVENGRVEMWRGICRSDISVSAPFVWRCLSGSTLTPFPHLAHRTGRADFPHPACMGLSLSRYHVIFVFLCHSILLFDPRCRAFFRPDRIFPCRRAQRRSRTALLQRRRRLVLDGREHGGRLPAIGWLAARGSEGSLPLVAIKREPRLYSVEPRS